MSYLNFINAFIEDTSVVVVVAYLLTRGRLLALLNRPTIKVSEQVSLGVLLGLLGGTEYVFPHLRYPYVTQTLFVTFAGLLVGGYASLVAAGVVLFASLLHWDGLIKSLSLLLTLLCSVLLSTLLRRQDGRHRLSPYLCFVSGILTQTVAALFSWGVATLTQSSFSVLFSLWSIGANGLGIILLGQVVTDAQLRSDAERFRLEAEKAQALATNFQLSALRARIHPHFLFNTLTSIAVLCRIAPEKAETAVLHLSHLMRRALESNSQKPALISEEISGVDAYIMIEKLRLGDRLTLQWEITPNVDVEAVRVPVFALLTLVENAVQHGIANRPASGEVIIRLRHVDASGWLHIGVQDDGCGMTQKTSREAFEEKTQDRLHGLMLLDQQLRLLYGNKARVRLFSVVNRGTIAAFQVPLS